MRLSLSQIEIGRLAWVLMDRQYRDPAARRQAHITL
jgi:hypothetical protein